jgi:hypothetical protein
MQTTKFKIFRTACGVYALAHYIWQSVIEQARLNVAENGAMFLPTFRCDYHYCWEAVLQVDIFTTFST